MEKEINGIKLRTAETKLEKMLLGLLYDEANRVGFGKIIVEFGIRNGKINRLSITEISRTVNIGELDSTAGGVR